MIPGRPECTFCDEPAGREDDEVGDCSARDGRRSGENSENGRVRVVIGYATNSVKAAEVVFVGIVRSMPCYNVEWRMRLCGGKKTTVELGQQSVFCLGAGMVFDEISGRGLKVTCISQTIGPDGAKLRKLEVALVKLENVASYGTVGK